MMDKIVLFLSLVFLASCGNPEPQPIEYGKEQCYYCKMNIVDNQHASEIVTKKGKAFKYDAIECMLNDLANRDDSEIALYLVCDYAQPGVLIDATQAHFLISKEIPSPMGANLSAFKSEQTAQKTQKEKTGDVYDWEILRTKVFKH